MLGFLRMDVTAPPDLGNAVSLEEAATTDQRPFW